MPRTLVSKARYFNYNLRLAAVRVLSAHSDRDGPEKIQFVLTESTEIAAWPRLRHRTMTYRSTHRHRVFPVCPGTSRSVTPAVEGRVKKTC